MTTTLHAVETKDVHSLICEMENEIGEALRFANALAMAIEGIGRMVHMDDEDEKSALRALAFEGSSAAAKFRSNGKSYSNSQGANGVGAELSAGPAECSLALVRHADPRKLNPRRRIFFLLLRRDSIGPAPASRRGFFMGPAPSPVRSAAYCLPTGVKLPVPAPLEVL
jgi:hypothetical protein